MQNREFENKVQGKMDELKLTPTDAVWDKVEASLPKEKKRRWVIFILLFAVFMISGFFIWNVFNKPAVNNTAKEISAENETNAINKVPGKRMGNIKPNDTITGLATTTKNIVTENGPGKNKKENFGAVTRINIKKTREASLIDVPANTDYKALITKGGTKMKVKKPAKVDPAEETIAKTGNADMIADSDLAPEVVMHDSLSSIPSTPMIDSAIAIKKDTAITVTKENKKNRKNDHWHYGIELAGGTSNVKSNLFSNGQVYADRFSSTMSFPGSGNPVSTNPNKPARNAGLTAGLYAEKNISQKWTFKTGLNYLYQSNTIKVGKKIDSVINFSLDINKSLTASSYYRTGDSVSYKDNFHLLEIPLIFQYQFSKSPHFYLEAGPSITYLLQSNALVYSSRSQAYVTDKDIFNKLGISFNGGATIDLARRSTFPFSIGYRFKYSMGSVVKTSFGKQHFINSFLYLKIPFKK
jgi:hypothetical protein